MKIDIESLAVSLAGRSVLHNLSLSIPSGASAAILGVSGVGKTTLLRCVAGLLTPSAGLVLLGEESQRSCMGREQWPSCSKRLACGGT